MSLENSVVVQVMVAANGQLSGDVGGGALLPGTDLSLPAVTRRWDRPGRLTNQRSCSSQTGSETIFIMFIYKAKRIEY